MGHVYTPGLKVTAYTNVKKRRILPLKGKVMVEEGQVVKPYDIIARTELPGNVDQVNVANFLGCDPEDLPNFIKAQPGEEIEKGAVYAQNKGLFGTGLFKTSLKMPFKGTIDSISKVTGNILLRAEPIPVEVTAYIEGKVQEVIPEQGVIVESNAMLIQGIFGFGGEHFGEIVIIGGESGEDLKAEMIKDSHRGKILVCGGRVTSKAFRKAEEIGACGIIAGGIYDSDVKDILGYDIGVAITGSEDLETTVVITEGFGDIPMADRTLQLLKDFEGREGSINGATQIRAGVIRPEIVVFQPKPPEGYEEILAKKIGLDLGSPVRVIRYPHFGRLGKVVELPPELRALESESKARVLKVKFDDGSESVVPRANVETIETF